MSQATPVMFAVAAFGFSLLLTPDAWVISDALCILGLMSLAWTLRNHGGRSTRRVFIGVVCLAAYAFILIVNHT